MNSSSMKWGWSDPAHAAYRITGRTYEGMASSRNFLIMLCAWVHPGGSVEGVNCTLECGHLGGVLSISSFNTPGLHNSMCQQNGSL